MFRAGRLRRIRVGQQEIVFVVFAVLFVVFSVLLPGFLTADNMLTLLQNVAVLGILGLAMAIVVIGRGIDISLIATLAVPPGLVLQMVQNGHSLAVIDRHGFCYCDRLWSDQWMADRLCRGALTVRDTCHRDFSCGLRPGRAVPGWTSCSGATASKASSDSDRAACSACRCRS